MSADVCNKSNHRFTGQYFIADSELHYNYLTLATMDLEIWYRLFHWNLAYRITGCRVENNYAICPNALRWGGSWG